MATLERIVIVTSSSEILSSIWYADGSGRHGNGSGVEGLPDDWKVVDIKLYAGGRVEITATKSEPA